jgi:uncharacterized protein (TIGR03435 family)
MKRPVSLLALTLACASIATPQPDLRHLSFEAASIRPSTSGFNGMRGGCRGIDSGNVPDNAAIPLGRCVVTNARLSHLIMTAWQVNYFMLRNAPGWVIGGDERYNLQATASDPNVTEAQLFRMLQELLEDRFRLTYHRENREAQGYALVVTKKGPKLEKSRDGEIATLDASETTFSARKYSMSMFASWLSALGSVAVKDETGLPDFYNIDLMWNEATGPSMATALQEKSGLRLESRKVPVSFFVIDSAARPGPN